jgi:hypothetical protein
MIQENALAAADVEHRAAGPQVVEVGGDHGVAGQLVDASEEVPAAAAILGLPLLPGERHVAPSGPSLAGGDPPRQPSGEREPAAEEQPIVDREERPERLSGGAGERPDEPGSGHRGRPLAYSMISPPPVMRYPPVRAQISANPGHGRRVGVRILS